MTSTPKMLNNANTLSPSILNCQKEMGFHPENKRINDLEWEGILTINVDNEHHHFSGSQKYLIRNVLPIQPKFFPCTNDSECLKDKSIIVIVWPPNNIPCLHCSLYQMEVAQSSLCFTRSNEENEFFMSIFFPIDLIQILKTIAEQRGSRLSESSDLSSFEVALLQGLPSLRVHLTDVPF